MLLAETACWDLAIINTLDRYLFWKIDLSAAKLLLMLTYNFSH
jgi:hypothetical protein